MGSGGWGRGCQKEQKPKDRLKEDGEALLQQHRTVVS